MVKYIVKTGESLEIELLVVSDSQSSITDVATVTAAIKKSTGTGLVPPRTTPSAAIFAALPKSDGWTFSLAPSITKTLDPGIYVMDAEIVMVSGLVRITDPILIEVRGTVS